MRSPPPALFLHAGWRSCGTVLWQALRRAPGVRAYYEPLHEGLARFARADIAGFRPENWGSGHGEGAPYFAEYEALLRPRGGVAGFSARFAFEDFFAPATYPDEALKAYLTDLIDRARAAGAAPALKFCRSQGRAAWLHAAFPDARHVAVLRDPVAQWRSARLQMERDHNVYFVVAPFMILARNAQAPLLAAAMTALGVRTPPTVARAPAALFTTAWRHVQRLDWAARYRGFLALWCAASAAVLAEDFPVIDADALHEAPARAAAEALLSEAAGAPVVLPPIHAHARAFPGTPAEQADAAVATSQALAFVAAAQLPEASRALLAAKLRTVFPGAAAAHAAGSAMPPPGLAATADAALYLSAAYATYPLRRLHGMLHERLHRAKAGAAP